MNESYGTVSEVDGLPRVTFERVLDAAIDVLWSVLATEEGLERWLAPAKIDLRIGGAVDLDFGEGEVAGGKIIELEPGRTLEYRWRFTGEPDSIIRFELHPIDDSTTRLTLDHRLLPADQAIGYAAGWHAHLDALASALESKAEFDWMARFNELMPEYQTP